MNNYTEEVKQILKRSELIGIKENNEYVTTKHIILAIKDCLLYTSDAADE